MASPGDTTAPEPMAPLSPAPLLAPRPHGRRGSFYKTKSQTISCQPHFLPNEPSRHVPPSRFLPNEPPHRCDANPFLQNKLPHVATRHSRARRRATVPPP